MKKKIIIVSILIVLVIILLLIPRDVYKKIFKKEPTPGNDSPAISQVYQTLFVKNSNNQLIGIQIPVNAIEEDEIGQKWDLLTSLSSLIPSEYDTPIAKNTTLFSHEMSNNTLTLNVSTDFLSSEGRIAIECLAWNFCDDDISEVVVKVDNQEVNEVNNFYFDKIDKSMGVNFTFETNYLFEANHLTIVYHENNTIMPVTYFYDNSINKMDYMVAKIFDSTENMSDLVSSKAYSYEIKNNKMVINFDYNDTFSEDLMATITDTIKQNYIIDSFTVNGTQSVLLEEVFYPLENQ